MSHPVTPLRLLSAPCGSPRAAPLILRLARGGSGCRVLTTADMLAEIGEAPAPIARVEHRPAGSTMPTVTFRRINSAPKTYDASASGSAVEAGVSYDFDVDAFGDVQLWRDDRRVPSRHKAPLRAAILAAYRAATAASAMRVAGAFQ